MASGFSDPRTGRSQSGMSTSRENAQGNRNAAAFGTNFSQAHSALPQQQFGVDSPFGTASGGGSAQLAPAFGTNSSQAHLTRPQQLSGVGASTGTASERGSATQTLQYLDEIKSAPKRLNTLYLTLKDTAQSFAGDKVKKDDQKVKRKEKELQQKVEELRDEILGNVEKFKRFVFSQKPVDTHSSDYERQERIYREQLKLAISVSQKMNVTVSQTFDLLRDYIDRMWEAILKGNDTSGLLNTLNVDLEKLINDPWDKIFKEFEHLRKQVDDESKAVPKY